MTLIDVSLCNFDQYCQWWKLNWRTIKTWDFVFLNIKPYTGLASAVPRDKHQAPEQLVSVQQTLDNSSPSQLENHNTVLNSSANHTHEQGRSAPANPLSSMYVQYSTPQESLNRLSQLDPTLIMSIGDLILDSKIVGEGNNNYLYAENVAWTFKNKCSIERERLVGLAAKKWAWSSCSLLHTNSTSAVITHCTSTSSHRIGHKFHGSRVSQMDKICTKLKIFKMNGCGLGVYQ